ncbi:30S ribosomal protein S4 [bacterium]|nr:30S ribosomal protein S4 [bacterium]
MKYTGPVCRLCRREQTKLFLKGERCYTEKCPMEFSKTKKSRGIPGTSGKFRRRLTDYGVQLREKQKMKRYYLITEKQFSNYVKKAATIKEGTKSENLFKLLESRFDMIVFRLGFARSKMHARQMVTHGSFMINKKKVDIPSYILKTGDIIEFRKEVLERQKNLEEMIQDIDPSKVPEWLTLNKDAKTGHLEEPPRPEEIKEKYFPTLKENLIIEYYSR